MRRIIVVLVLLFTATSLSAQAPQMPILSEPRVTPPSSIQALDRPNDAGHAIRILWDASPDEAKGLVEGYEIFRTEAPDAPDSQWVRAGYVPYGFTSFDDQTVPENGQDFYYKIKLSGKNGEAWSSISNGARSQEQWFNTARINALIATVLFIVLVIYFINKAKHGHHLFIRRIAGLAAVEEAVGRATEMGRPILFVPGISSIADVATIAALNILGQVAKKTAEYETPLLVPNRDPVVYVVAQEIVKEAYAEVGRPDAYNPDSVFFLTDSQMGYAAGVDGIMAREKPATNFFLGMFYAESLILAETGAETGAIQIAGTDAVNQLPFFITACDYTLIGEELYAASAYLSREPMLLGTLKGQDWSKAIIVLLLVIGVILAWFHTDIRQLILTMLAVG